MIILTAFYCYRLWVETERRNLIIIGNKLQEKVYSGKLDNHDRKNIAIILNSIALSKLKVNLLALLIMSALALAIEIFIDLKVF